MDVASFQEMETCHSLSSVVLFFFCKQTLRSEEVTLLSTSNAATQVAQLQLTLLSTKLALVSPLMPYSVYRESIEPSVTV